MRDEPSGDERARREAIRREIRERLARGVYALESSRDRTDDRPRATWEQLNQGRRATRLNHADELLSTLFGALGLGWDEVDGIRACAAAAPESPVDAARRAAAERAAEIVAALLPLRVGGGGGDGDGGAAGG